MTLIDSIPNPEKFVGGDGTVAIPLDDHKPGEEAQTTRGSVITYHNVCFTVRVKPDKKCACGKVEKQILHNMNGIFKPGMNAIMGPTGGGKSSLLDLLAGRKNPAWLSGTVMVDGKRQPLNFNRMAGYVIQEDIVMGTLTVRENIMFSANLRLPRSLGHKEKLNRVSEIIKELGLTKCADTRVGAEFKRGVSGGEKKRTSIGMEMIVSPNILFLDEPTTGLDANTAGAVMSLLHRLSLNGRTIIFSIHQPRYSIFKLFHRLTLLADGRTIFHGPTDEALEYFNSIGYTCEVHDNPSDFFLDVIKEDRSRNSDEPSNKSDGEMATEVQRQLDVPFSSFLNQKYLESLWASRISDELKHYPVPAATKDISFKNMFIEQYTTSFLTQCKYLAGRSMKNLLRSPQAVLSQVIVSVIFAVIIGLLYLRLDLKENVPNVAIQNRVGGLFFITVNQMFANMPAVELFIRERILFKHENGSGYYRTVSYFFSKLICDVLPMRVIPVTVFSLVSYFMIGFQYRADKFFIFYFGLLTTSLTASSLSFAIGASSSSIPLGTMLLSLIYVLSMLFGGFLSNVKTMGDWLSWISYFSIVRYSLTIQYVNQLADAPIQVLNTTTNLPQMDLGIGNQYLDELGFTHVSSYDIGKNFIALICIGIILLFITYIKLRTLTKYK